MRDLTFRKNGAFPRFAPVRLGFVAKTCFAAFGNTQRALHGYVLKAIEVLVQFPKVAIICFAHDHIRGSSQGFPVTRFWPETGQRAGVEIEAGPIISIFDARPRFAFLDAFSGHAFGFPANHAKEANTDGGNVPSDESKVDSLQSTVFETIRLG